MAFIWLPAPPRFRRWLGRLADIQALRSDSGQNSIGSDRTVACSDDSICRVDITVAPSGIFRELDVFTDDLAERRIRLRGLQAAVEIVGGLDITVTEQPLDGFIVARVV